MRKFQQPRPNTVRPNPVTDWIGANLVGLVVTAVVSAGVAMIVEDNLWWVHRVPKRSTCLCQMLQLEQAVDSHRRINGALPADLGDLSGEDTPWGLHPVPQVPWGGEYRYEVIDATRYTLVSLGPDGLPGGEDDDADITRASLRRPGPDRG